MKSGSIDFTEFPQRDIDRERAGDSLERSFMYYDSRVSVAKWAESIEPHGRIQQHAFGFMRQFVSDFDLDGWLNMHALFLLDTKGWESILGSSRYSTLLDIGAGRGDVTATLAPLFEQVAATETSKPMVRRLLQRGFEAHAIDLAEQDFESPRLFSVVAMLNVLDRCSRPRSLIERALECLEPDGLLVLATPLPFRPHVDVGGSTVDPDELMPVVSECFETATRELVDSIPGIEIIRWSRIPYVSQGDWRQPLVALDDAVLVGRKLR